MQFITDFQQTWADPQLRHAMLVHWPIVLSVLSIFFVLLMAFNGARSFLLRTFALLICAGVMAAGYIAVQSGDNADHSVKVDPGPARDMLHEHEELAEKVPYFGAVCTFLILCTFIPKPVIRKSAAWLAVLSCLGTAGWVANTAHFGGHLVYEHGVGTPGIAAPSAPSAPAPTTPAETKPTTPPATSGAIETKPADGSPTVEPRPATPSEEEAKPLSDDPKVAFFQTQIKPIILETCAKCHNASRARRSGGLDQTSLAAIMKGGRSGPVIVIGKPEDSLLIKRVKGEIEGDDLMPPPPRDPLTTEQIAALEQWIRDGAVWE